MSNRKGGANAGAKSALLIDAKRLYRVSDYGRGQMIKKLSAEFIGAACLVLFGCGSAVLAGADVGQLGISFAFGLAIVAMAYGIGMVSGCHINPAVSFGVWAAGRMKTDEMLLYWVAQVLGAIVGAGLLFAIAHGKPGYDLAVNGLGQNGFGPGYLGGYSMQAAFTWETAATFLFLVTILGVTQSGAPAHLAGLAIGLTLVVIHIVGIQVTGVSVNPARSLGPAVIVQGQALSQLWLFIIAPLLGALAAGLLFRTKHLAA
jgi:aquaporin Z